MVWAVFSDIARRVEATVPTAAGYENVKRTNTCTLVNGRPYMVRACGARALIARPVSNGPPPDSRAATDTRWARRGSWCAWSRRRRSTSTRTACSRPRPRPPPQRPSTAWSKACPASASCSPSKWCATRIVSDRMDPGHGQAHVSAALGGESAPGLDRPDPTRPLPTRVATATVAPRPAAESRGPPLRPPSAFSVSTR